MSRSQGLSPLPATVPAPGWLERLRDWRHRTVARPAFQRWAAAFALTRPVARREARALFDLVAGFVYTQVLLAGVRADLCDRLADGPREQSELARAAGLPAEGLERLVAAAVAVQLLERRPGARVALGRLGAPLVGNRAITSMILHHAALYADLQDPLALLRRELRPSMNGFWAYVGEDGGSTPAVLSPERAAEYSALMSHSQPLVIEQVLAACDLSGHRALLDVGGGEGRFVEAVAARAPRIDLMLFDLPPVAELARARLGQAGLGPRVRTFGGDFFADALPGGADIVSLVRVCFDHPDERVLRLLRSVRRALPDDGHVLLAEPMSGVRGVEAMSDAYFGFYLMAMGRGRTRSAADFAALLQAAGFEPPRSLPTHMPLHASVLLARCRPGPAPAS